MNRNTIVGSLVGLTGLLFVTGIFLDFETMANAKIICWQLGVVSGISAVATRFLIKENTNG